MTLVTYDRLGEVATITMDAGKVNVLSPEMLGDLGTVLDRAEADDAIVVLTGRDGVFSAGFDLGVLARGDEAAPMASRLCAGAPGPLVPPSGHCRLRRACDRNGRVSAPLG